MPKVSRAILIALAPLVIATTLVAKETASSKHGFQVAQIAASLDDIANSQRERLKPSVETQPCKRGADNSRSDLCAQWTAADAANRSADWTMYGVIVGVLGSALLLWQIALTRSALRETGNATKAMLAANRIAAQAQRPWITIDIKPVHITQEGSQIKYRADAFFRNTGSSAAENFTGSVLLHFHDDDFTDRMLQWVQGSAAQYERSAHVLPPGDLDMIPCFGVTDTDGVHWSSPQNSQPRAVPIVTATAYYTIEGDPDVVRRVTRSFVISEADNYDMGRGIVRGEGRSVTGEDLIPIPYRTMHESSQSTEPG